MAHALYGYDGPCKNIHGHSYKLEVTVAGVPLDNPAHPKSGMLMDFSDLSKMVKDEVVSRMDHALVLNGNSPHREIKHVDEHFEKIIYVDYQPTCENLLIDFVKRIKPLMPLQVQLHSVCLHETATSVAKWFADDN